MTDHKISQHILNKKRQNRRQLIWAISLATITVLAMTYYDVKVREYIPDDMPEVAYHYVSSDAEVKYIPNDSSGLTVWQGTLAPQADGSVNVVDAPVTPVNFAQRQTDLYLNVPSIPAKAVSAMAKTIEEDFKRWDKHGSMVMDGIFNVSKLHPSEFNNLMLLFDTIHISSDGLYRYTLAFDPLDKNDFFVQLDEPKRQELLKTVYSLNIRVTAENADKAMTAADTFGHPFSVLVPKGTNVTNFETDAAAKAKHFTHFIRDITPPESEPAAAH